VLPWKPHTSQVAGYLSARRPFQLDMAQFQLQCEICAATPSTNLSSSLGRRISLGLLLKESVRKFPQFYLGRSVILAGNNYQLKVSDKVYLKDILTVSQSLMHVVSLTNEMFGHPLATLAVTNEHLDAIRETPFTCSNKSCEANGIEGKS